MSPGGREMAPSGGEREDAGPGLLTHIMLLWTFLLVTEACQRASY